MYSDRLPHGLPARFTSGKDGLFNLQDALGLPNRKELQAVMRVSVVKLYLKPFKAKFRRLKTSQRLLREAIAFYGDPDQRRVAWEVSLLKLDPSRSVPSLEYEALKRYEPRFITLRTPRDEIDRSLQMFSGYSYCDWEEFSLDKLPLFHIWPALRDDLLHWESLAPERQDDVALAIFAFSTLLNDARFIAWAASRVESLNSDFSFALKRYEGLKFLASSQNPESERYEEIVRDWKRNCESMIAIAEDLMVDSSQTQMLDDLQKNLNDLYELGDNIESAMRQRDRAIAIEEIEFTIGKYAENCNAAWLASISDRVLACWKLEYIFASNLDRFDFNSDVDRCIARLKSEVPKWRKREDERLECRKKLLELEINASDSLDVQLEDEDREAELHKRMGEVARRANHAKRRILKALAPSGKDFDPSRDYPSEFAEARRKAGLASRPSQARESNLARRGGRPTPSTLTALTDQSREDSRRISA